MSIQELELAILLEINSLYSNALILAFSAELTTCTISHHSTTLSSHTINKGVQGSHNSTFLFR